MNTSTLAVGVYRFLRSGLRVQAERASGRVRSSEAWIEGDLVY